MFPVTSLYFFWHFGRKKHTNFIYTFFNYFHILKHSKVKMLYFTTLIVLLTTVTILYEAIMSSWVTLNLM